MKRYLSMLLVLVLVLASWSVASADEIKDLRDYQTIANEMETYCYQYSQKAVDLNVLSNAYDHLLTNDPNGGLQPAIATEWYTNDNSKSWTFVCREDAKWVDYEGNYMADVVAEDFATGLEWVLNYYKNQSANIEMPISMIEGASEYYEYTKGLSEEEGKALGLEKFYEMVGVTVEGNTITFSCVDQLPWFPTLACYNCLAPLSAKLIEKVGVDGYFGGDNTTIWYNGPYTITYFVHNNEKVFTKNPLYYDTDAKLFDTVTVKMVDDSNVAFEMFVNGELDYVELNETQIKLISDPSNEWNQYLVPTQQTKYSYSWKWNYNKCFEDGTPDVNWNTAIANEAFRLSMVYGLDMTAYLARTNTLAPLSLQNYAYTARNLVAKSDGTEYTQIVLDNLGIDMSDLGTYLRYDPDKAAAYKAQAIEELTAQGVTFPVELAWYYAGSNQAAADTAAVLAQIFSDFMGDDYIVLKSYTYINSFSKEVSSAKLQSVASSGWGADYADPYNFIGQEIVGDDDAYFANAYTNINDVDPETDLYKKYEVFTNMVKEARAITGDIDARYDALAAAEAYMIEHGLSYPTYYNKSWQLTCINDATKIYSLYGNQSERYINWETNDAIYTAEEYAALGN